MVFNSYMEVCEAKLVDAVKLILLHSLLFMSVCMTVSACVCFVALQLGPRPSQ